MMRVTFFDLMNFKEPTNHFQFNFAIQANFYSLNLDNSELAIFKLIDLNFLVL